jgi:hypothetical protein
MTSATDSNQFISEEGVNIEGKSGTRLSMRHCEVAMEKEAAHVRRCEDEIGKLEIELRTAGLNESEDKEDEDILQSSIDYNKGRIPYHQGRVKH